MKVEFTYFSTFLTFYFLLALNDNCQSYVEVSCSFANFGIFSSKRWEKFFNNQFLVAIWLCEPCESSNCYDNSTEIIIDLFVYLHSAQNNNELKCSPGCFHFFFCEFLSYFRWLKILDLNKSWKYANWIWQQKNKTRVLHTITEKK